MFNIVRPQKPAASLLNIAESLARLPRIGSQHPRALADKDSSYSGIVRLRRQLESEGFELIANGSFSIVLKHKDWPGRVLKISTRTDMVDAAVAYWQYCLENRGKKGKHLPVVYATGKLMFAGIAMPYVWMKAYTPGISHERYRLAHWFDWCDDSGLWSQRKAHADNNIDSESWFTILQEARAFGRPDFHEDNMMYDPELATFIITDPVW